MTTRDLHSNYKTVEHLAIAAYTTTQTPTNGVDTQGFSSLDFLIHIGTIANIAQSPTPSWAFKLQESDTVDSGFADVTDSNQVLIGSTISPVVAPDSSTGVFLTVDASTEDNHLYRVGYLGKKRYVRVVATAANTPGSTVMAIDALLGHPGLTPTAD